jgi:hypothetical protein
MSGTEPGRGEKSCTNMLSKLIVTGVINISVCSELSLGFKA